MKVIAVLCAIVICFVVVNTAGADYVVQPGDCLWTIGQRYGVSVDRLVALNSIKNRDLIFPGQVLHIAGIGAIEYAMAQLGKVYKLGGIGPDSFDCSGLVWSAFHQEGVNLPRIAHSQYLATIPAQEPQARDLSFYCEVGVAVHVGLMISRTMMVHASSYRGKVAVESPFNYVNWCGFGRIK